MVDTSTTPLQLIIMYASELGNCEQISEDLLKNLKKTHSSDDSVIASAKRIAMNHYN